MELRAHLGGPDTLVVEPFGELGGITVGHEHLLRPGCQHRLIEAVPVGVIGEHEAAVGGPAAAHAPHGHPAGGHTGGVVLKPPHPSGIHRRGGRDDQAAFGAIAHAVDRCLWSRR